MQGVVVLVGGGYFGYQKIQNAPEPVVSVSAPVQATATTSQAADSKIYGYTLEALSLVHADTGTFSPVFTRDSVPTNFAKDKNNVYNMSRYETLSGVDVSSFSLIYDIGGGVSNYVKDKNYVWYINPCEVMCGTDYVPYEIVQGADLTTFVSVSGQQSYDAQDKNNKYLLGGIVK